MDLGPEEKFLKFSEVSQNRALKRFAQFFVQPAVDGLKRLNLKIAADCRHVRKIAGNLFIKYVLPVFKILKLIGPGQDKSMH